ncbi:unnamed protein product [Prorocentrum cordatum]|uniref:Thioredoxin domain-containing protein n=1 Tax=Prorocentrum cordatum TaxID=2364126 RepID=A0ABN9RE42_9DINO|nr:unnamed protein product [Polarella glacialis]
MLTGRPCGVHGLPRPGPVDDSAAEREALAAVARMGFVGLTEEWPTSVCLFHARFGGECFQASFKNVRPGKANHRYDTFVGYITWSMGIDDVLYGAARERFWKDVAAHGVTPERCRTEICPAAAEFFEEASSRLCKGLHAKTSGRLFTQTAQAACRRFAGCGCRNLAVHSQMRRAPERRPPPPRARAPMAWAAARLSDRGILRVAGAGSGKFLQGLCTQDVGALGAQRAVPAAFLSPKGKVLCDTILVANGADDILIDCHADAARSLLRLLKKHRLREKFQIEDVSGEVAAVALLPEEAAGQGAAAPTEAAVAESFADPRFAALGRRAVLPSEAAGPPAEGADAASALAAYHRWRVCCAVPEGPRDLPVDAVMPLHGNLDLLNFISFRKGCYVGQELTTRTKHRGAVRRRFFSVVSAEGCPAAFLEGLALEPAAPLPVRAALGARGRALPGEEGPAEARAVHARMQDAESSKVVGELHSVAGTAGLCALRCDRQLNSATDFLGGSPLAEGTELSAGEGIALGLRAPPYAFIAEACPRGGTGGRSVAARAQNTSAPECRLALGDMVAVAFGDAPAGLGALQPGPRAAESPALTPSASAAGLGGKQRRTFFGYAENQGDDEPDAGAPAHGSVMVLQGDGDLEHLLSKLPAEWVVVEFSAERSPACLAMKPAFESLAKERPQLAFARVDVGRMPKTALAHAATRVPSYLFLWDGVPEADFAGASERRLRDTMEDCLKLGPTAWKECEVCGKLMHAVRLLPHQNPVTGDCRRLCPNEGCSGLFSPEELEEHRASCEHMVIQCAFKGCFFCGKTLDMKAHAQCCEHRLVECTLCGAQLKASELEGHMRSCPGAPPGGASGARGAESPDPREAARSQGGTGDAEQGGPPGQPRECPPDGADTSEQLESPAFAF